MLVIRFLRTGKKGQAFFKIVVTEKQKAPTKGRFVEEVGFYNPLTKEKNVKADRVKYWLSVGAQPSDTVYNLLISEKVIEGKKISAHAKPKKKEETKEEKPAEEKTVEVKPQPTTETPKEEKKESVEAQPQQTEQKEKTEEKPAPEPKGEPSDEGKSSSSASPADAGSLIEDESRQAKKETEAPKAG